MALLLFVSLGVYVWRTASRKEPETAGSSVG
jgi:hypothetical protein